MKLRTAFTLLSPLLLLTMGSCGNVAPATQQSETSSSHESVLLIEFVFFKNSGGTLSGKAHHRGGGDFPYQGTLPSLDFEDDVVFVEDPDPRVSGIDLTARFKSSGTAFVDQDGTVNPDYVPKAYDHLLLVGFDSLIQTSFPEGCYIDKAFYQTPRGQDAINAETIKNEKA